MPSCALPRPYLPVTCCLELQLTEEEKIKVQDLVWVRREEVGGGDLRSNQGLSFPIFDSFLFEKRTPE